MYKYIVGIWVGAQCMQNNEFEKIKNQLFNIDLKILKLQKSFCESLESMQKEFEQLLNRKFEEADKNSFMFLDSTVTEEETERFIQTALNSLKETNFDKQISKTEAGFLHTIKTINQNIEKDLEDLVLRIDLEKSIQSFMKGLDIANINQEEMLSYDAEWQEKKR